jgi:hypothetical protein
LREEHRLTVFVNRVLRKIFGPKSDDVTRGWIKLHNKELHNLYSSPNDGPWMTISRRLGGRGMYEGDEKCVQKFWLERPKRTDHSENLVVGGRIILKWTSGKHGWRVWFGFIRLWIVTGGGLL